MSESLWKDSVKMPEFKSPEGTLNTEVLIVGGGIRGILCAYFLDLLGVDYILAEAGNICGGLTGNTTAKITSQHGLIYDRMIKDYRNETEWTKKSLINIAGAGYFAADRSIREYAENIWHITKVK